MADQPRQVRTLTVEQYKVLKNTVFVLRRSGVPLTAEYQSALVKYERAIAAFEYQHGLTGGVVRHS